MITQLDPGQPPAGTYTAIAAWNLMGGIDWAALPIVREMLEVEDVERWLYQLAAIRDHCQRRL